MLKSKQRNGNVARRRKLNACWIILATKKCLWLTIKSCLFTDIIPHIHLHRESNLHECYGNFGAVFHLTETLGERSSSHHVGVRVTSEFDSHHGCCEQLRFRAGTAVWAFSVEHSIAGHRTTDRHHKRAFWDMQSTYSHACTFLELSCIAA